jgi:hypothetical protein
VADGGEEDLDAHLHALRRRDLHLLHHQRLTGTPRHRRCSIIHGAGAQVSRTEEDDGDRVIRGIGEEPLHLMGFPWVSMV